MIDLKEIMALCKRRGFVFQASEIYGGFNGFWDYGPLGIELKNNIRDAWWRAMVLAPPMGPDGLPVSIVGLDSAIIQHPKTWEASGHVGGFSDPMVDCTETKLRYRADHLMVYIANDEGPWPAFVGEPTIDEFEKRAKKLRLNIQDEDAYQKTVVFSDTERALLHRDKIIAPDASKVNTLTEPKQFNLMFETKVGATGGEDSKAYLRPETAQGIFLNFKNVVDSSRVRVPFGIAQIGKAYRNEVNPRNFIFRTREFEQMEMEFFCHPRDAATWADFWVATRKQWWLDLGLSEDQLYMRKQDQDELAHYAKAGVGTTDIEFEFPFTSPKHGEIEGVAHRCDFDLNAHQAASGQKLEYIDPETNERFIPHVIEPAAGLNRAFLALLCAAYTVDENRPSGMYLNFLPAMAPKKAAILPLTAKGAHPEIATKLYLELRQHYNVDLDIKQNIGKRYARQDEIGTPYCFTIDNDTETMGTVTVRDRNTTVQHRIHLSEVKAFLDEKIKAV